MPRFSSGDVGEARWPMSHGWTDTTPILPDAAHDSRNQGRVVSLSVLSLFLACVRLCQLREVHHSLLRALNPWSRTQRAATDGSPACCTSSLMLRVCVMLRALPSQSSVRSLLVLLLNKHRCLSCLARPVWGTIGRCRGVLPRTNARCINRETKFTATFDQNLPSIKYRFAFYSGIYRKFYLRDIV